MTVRIDLTEWGEVGSTDARLKERSLDALARAVAASLATGDRLIVTEHREGLAIQATSWVGRVRLGDLQITVQPKIAPGTLLALVRYAYGLRDLSLLHPSQYATGDRLFVDLLVAQLIDEVEELFGRGLHRRYEARTEVLASPRGRLDFKTLARTAGQLTTGLPCVHHPRLADNILNRALLAGLEHSAALASDPVLRITARRLSAQLAEDVALVSPKRLDIAAAERAVSRLTQDYTPALTLIRLLLEGAGLSLSGDEDHLRVRGFLFDMNKFFQRLLSRFLQEFLPASYSLADEHRLTEVMEYAPDQNPQRRRHPTPRPDFALLRQGKPVQFFDAKYRDLWERNMPADMLYQLAIYAMLGGASRTSVILYPALGGMTVDQRINVRDALGGVPKGSVILRGVDLVRMQRAIEDHDIQDARLLVAELLDLSAAQRGQRWRCPPPPRGARARVMPT
ncbi:MAG: McrC family protein [Dehalococcoidia bacterium]|nr:McrC family protein [Dehalococcoidia bacterium]